MYTFWIGLVLNREWYVFTLHSNDFGDCMQLRYHNNIKIGAKLIPFWNWSSYLLAHVSYYFQNHINNIYVQSYLCDYMLICIHYICNVQSPGNSLVIMCSYACECSQIVRAEWDKRNGDFRGAIAVRCYSNALSARALAFELVKSTNEIIFPGEKRKYKHENKNSSCIHFHSRNFCIKALQFVYAINLVENTICDALFW